MWFALTAAGVLCACAAGTLLDHVEIKTLNSYVQHEHAVQLANLSQDEQQDAASANIDEATFASHLPVISLDTKGKEIPGKAVRISSSEDRWQKTASTTPEAQDSAKTTPPSNALQAYTLADDGKQTISAQLKLFAQGEDGDFEDAGETEAQPRANRLSDAPVLSHTCELRQRGHSSRLFDKPSYAFKFCEENRQTGVDLNMLGMGAASSWVLNGPFLDKTLMRNYVSYILAGSFMLGTPEVRFCELFVNGSYQGIYLLLEQVEVSQDRLNLKPSDPNMSATSYLVRRDWTDATSERNVHELLKDIYMASGDATIELLYPSASSATEAQRAWIEDDLNAIEKALYSYDYSSGSYSYNKLLNVDSFVDYFLFNEFAQNTDAGSYSTYMYKDLGGRLSAGPVWDYNNAYDNNIEAELGPTGFSMILKPYFAMLLRDRAFTNQVLARWAELRRGPLSDAHIDELIDATKAYLEPAIERNFAVWGYSFNPEQVGQDARLAPSTRNPATYDEAIAQLKHTMHVRAGWMDQNINTLKQYSQASAVKKYND